MKVYSWACPVVVDARGNITAGGCGGNWGPLLPSACPRCGGPIRLLQEFRAVSL